MEIETLYNLFLNASGICTDTRKLEEGCLFFAFRGPNFDGNKFAELALQKGALAVVIDNPKLKLKGKNIILVENTLNILQKLATFHRQKLKTCLIAITGSNGKTTTKELTREILACKYKVLATQGNLNNHIGVPLTLLKLKTYHEIAIVEMGANHPGEIAALSEIAKPNWGFITNFGKAHLEGFGSLEGVIRSKSELYKHLINNNQKILINSDDLEQIKQTKGYEVSSFGQEEKANFLWEKLDKNGEEIKINFQGQSFQSRLYGEYNLTNLAASLAFAVLFEVPKDAIQKALYKFVLNNNRSQIIKIQNTEYILDAYNANPTSMLAALIAFDNKISLKKVVILGDMMELGKYSLKEHDYILNRSLGFSFEKIITIGTQFYFTTIKDDRILKFENLDSFKKTIDRSNWKYNDALIKGSRSLKLEDLIRFFNRLDI